MSHSGFSITSPTFRLRQSISLLSLFLLIAACGIGRADVSKAPASACALTDEEAAGLNGDASTDVHAVDNYSRTVYGIFQSLQFKKLDCLAQATRSGKETFAGGMWKIHAFYGGLSTPPLHPTQDDWNKHLKLLQQWASIRPNSISARVALAESYLNFGADARGPGFANTVSDSGWRLFTERTARAKQILDQASSLSAKDPEWYFAMQNVALAQEWGSDERQALLKKAIHFEPAYYYYYRAYANSILPKWGGKDGEVAEFLKKEADLIGGEAGDILYFRVAGNIVCGCEADQRLGLSWFRIQKGFAAVEKKSGPSLENLNLLAHMAESFRDPAIAAEAFARIGDQWSDVWQNSSNFESAKNWARQMGALMARKRPAEESAESNLHTPEGQRYNVAFAEKIKTWMEPCVKELGSNDLGTFELLIRVGKEGTIDDVTGGGNSPLMSCLGQTINISRQRKDAVFAPPPQPDYWVRFDLNPDNATSATLK